jgi:hypothetical protein
MGAEFERVVELPHGSWRSLKAHLTGGLGELFALIWLAQRNVSEGEVWGLRRGSAHGRAGPLRASPRALGFAPREGVEVWEGELKVVEVVEVKTGAGRLSKPQECALESLRREAEKARKALGRQVEVSYRVLRVELEKLELPKRAHITIQSFDL